MSNTKVAFAILPHDLKLKVVSVCTWFLADVLLHQATFPLAHREDIPDTPSLLLLAFRDLAVFTIQVWTFHCFHFSPFIVFTIQMETVHCSAPISPFNLLEYLTTCVFSGFPSRFVHSSFILALCTLPCYRHGDLDASIAIRPLSSNHSPAWAVEVNLLMNQT